MLEPRIAPTGPDGTYVFDSVAPGEYVVQASLPGRPTSDGGRSIEFAMKHVTVASGESLLVPVRTTLASRLRGRIAVDGMPTTRPPVISVAPLPADLDVWTMGGAVPGVVQDGDGSFEVSGVTGPRRFVVWSTFDGWYLKAARVRGVDALDAPFDFGSDGRDVDDIELVVSPAAASVSGRVSDAAGELRTDCAVVLFARDSSRWYRQSQGLRLERPSQNGEFRFGGLPPGAYYLAALRDVSDLVTTGYWQDPAVLETLRSSATEVTVNESDAKTMALRLMEGR
jgi:hypothetical protein